MNMFAKFGKIPVMNLKDIKETKCYWRMHGLTTWKQYTHPQSKASKICKGGGGGGYNELRNEKIN